MKRLVVALVAVGLTASLGAYAALPTGAQATEVIVPQEPDALFLGASLLYWQPAISGNDLDYAVTQFNSNTRQQTHNIDPNYDWGFDVFGGYNFGNGNDLMLEYLRLHTNDSSSTGGGTVTTPRYFANGPDTQILSGTTPDFDTYLSGKGKTDIDIDKGDLTVGQYLNLGCADQVRLFGGLRYVELQRQLNTWYSQNPSDPYNHNLGNGVTSTTVGADDGILITQATAGALAANDSSDFKGYGPLIGLNNSYYLGYGIGFTAAVDTGLLYGDVEDNLYITNFQPGVTDLGLSTGGVVLTPTVTHSGDAHRIVPTVDAKLGFDYTYPLQYFGSLTLEAGWNVSHYWGAVDSLSSGASSNDGGDGILGILPNAFSSGATTATPRHHTADIGYQGPYLTLTYRATPTV
jgi:hypothetical protein